MDECRKQFEQAMHDVFKTVVGSNDPYPAGLERDYWKVWQAAWNRRAEAVPEVSEDKIDAVSKALRKAWQLGQTYWQQADSESWKQNAKAGDTQDKFMELIEETRAMLAPEVKHANKTF